MLWVRGFVKKEQEIDFAQIASLRELSLRKIEGIGKMKALQRFQYPIADMSIYQNCPKITVIGIDSSRVQGFDVLTGNETIEDVMFYYLNSETQFEEQVKEISQYLDLSSYGYRGSGL